MSNQTRKPEKGDITAEIITNMGSIKVLLFPDAAPKAVENFTGLAQKGYYNGIIFHRVIRDFMIQGGDPTGTGMGGESLWVHLSRMNFIPIIIISAVLSLWLMQAPAPTAASSS